VPEFLTRRIGPLPVFAYAALGVIAFVWVRSRQAQSQPAQTAPLDVNPDYGTAGFAGQGALSPDSLLPISAASNTAFQPPPSSGGSSPSAPYGTDPYGNPYVAPGGAGNPVNRIASTAAGTTTSPGSTTRLPR